MPLTARQASFVAEYARTGNATQSAIAAGYSEKTARSVGSENLTKPDIQAALQSVSATAVQVVSAKLEAAVASEAWIVEKAVEVIEKALESDTQFAAATPALALLAKRHPAFKDGPVVDQSQHIHLPEGTSLADLKALADELRGQS